MSVIFQRTRSEELHLDHCVNCGIYRERPYEARCQAQARNRHCSGPRARIEVISCPTRSWLSHTARYRCVWELYRSSSTQETACRAFWLARGGTVTSRRGHETHRHDYTRLPAALSDELGRLSTSLGLFVSPPRILSTESVVGMEWKGTSTAIATRAGGLSRSYCS